MAKYTPQSLEQRIATFWSHVEKSGDGDACWNWANPSTGGYGCLWWAGRKQPAHRISWELAFGKPPGEQWVLHKCDNRRCVNPKHLFLGNASDNMLDMYSKDRHVLLSGESQHLHKLTNESVVTIRARYTAGSITLQSLADEYGVTPATISKVILRRTWKHIA